MRSRKSEDRSQDGQILALAGDSSARWVPVVLVVLTLLVMGRLCGMDFTWWDDDKVLHQNPLMNPPTWETLRHYWTRPYMGLYVPVTYTVWSGLAAIAHLPTADDRGIALNPWVFHSANVLLHVSNVLLVYAILRLAVKRPWAAGVGAAVFAVHPVQVESVGWVAGLKDLLAGTFVLGAVWQYLLFAMGRRDGEEKVRGHYWAGLGFMVLAMLSKPGAVVTPILIGALDVWVVGRSWRAMIRDLWPWVAAVVPCLVWAKVVQTVPPRGPMWSRPLVAMDAVAFYLGKVVWPGEMAVDYGRNPTYVIGRGLVWWTWVVPVGVGIALWAGRRRWPVLVGAGLVFVGGMAPMLGLTPFMFQGASTVTDHYLYLPMLGVALATAWVVGRWPTKGVAAVAGVLIGAMGAMSVVQAGVWRDDETLDRHAIAVTPRSILMRTNLAAALEFRAVQERDERLRDEAVAQLREVLRINPDSVTAGENLATIMIKRGQIDDAIRLLSHALSVADRVPAEEREKLGPSHRVLGAVLAKRGRYAEAAEQYRKALEYEPGSNEIERELAEVEARRQKSEDGSQKK